jgi:hypothetical protein
MMPGTEMNTHTQSQSKCKKTGIHSFLSCCDFSLLAEMYQKSSSYVATDFVVCGLSEYVMHVYFICFVHNCTFSQTDMCDFRPFSVTNNQCGIWAGVGRFRIVWWWQWKWAKWMSRVLKASCHVIELLYMEFGLVIRFTEHLQNVTRNNYDSRTELLQKSL